MEHGQEYTKARSSPRPRRHRDRTLMRANDPEHHSEAEPPAEELRGEERIEDPLEIPLGDATPGVGDIEASIPADLWADAHREAPGYRANNLRGLP